jgi:hypothetical protein
MKAVLILWITILMAMGGSLEQLPDLGEFRFHPEAAHVDSMAMMAHDPVTQGFMTADGKPYNSDHGMDLNVESDYIPRWLVTGEFE